MMMAQLVGLLYKFLLNANNQTAFWGLGASIPSFKMFRIFLLTILFVFICNLCFADKLIIPFDVYPKEVRKEFKKYGFKLDLNGNDRTKKSWGFIVNEGTHFTIYTYESINAKELELTQKIIFSLDNLKFKPQEKKR